MLYVHSTKEPHFSAPRGVIRHIPLTTEWIFKRKPAAKRDDEQATNLHLFPGKIQ